MSGEGGAELGSDLEARKKSTLVFFVSLNSYPLSAKVIIE